MASLLSDFGVPQGGSVMEQIPKAKDMRPTYENFIACCPWCERENIFNRASDLKNLAPISYLEVGCLFPDCAKPFYINGDRANSLFEMIIWDCYELLEKKQYAYCILNLAQAFEIFFGQYLRVHLLYKPFASDPDQDIQSLMDLERLLYERTEKLPFEDMKNLFLTCVVETTHPTSLSQAKIMIDGIAKKPPCPTDEEIRNASGLADERVRELLLRLKCCKVAQKRNQVVHKSAYRPTLDEVNAALTETREILFPLNVLLEVDRDDVNWYMRRRE